MAKSTIYFGIGFVVAALLVTPLIPVVHKRAARLTARRIEAVAPFSIAEIRDRDQLRAEFATSTRRLEISAEQMNTKLTNQLAELGRKTDAINRLTKELVQKAATVFAPESRDKNLQDQLRLTEEELELKNSSLREAEGAIADNEAQCATLLADLSQRSTTVDNQGEELAGLRLQVEAMKRSIADYEHVMKVTEECLVRQHGEAEAVKRELDEARGKLDAIAARTGELERQLVVPTTEAELQGRRVQDLEMRLGNQDRLLAEREFEIGRLRGDLEAARKTKSDLYSAVEECSALQREIATRKEEAETNRATMLVENARLHEHIIDVVAEVAWLIAVLEGPGSLIESLLAGETPPLGNRTPGANAKSDESGGDATPDLQRPGKVGLADRIRAMQSTFPTC